MNADELNDLLEISKQETPVARRQMARIDALLMEQHIAQHTQQYRTYHNPIDAIQLINNLISSYNHTDADVERIYFHLREAGQAWGITDIDVRYHRESPRGRELTIRLYNGTVLIYNL